MLVRKILLTALLLPSGWQAALADEGLFDPTAPPSSLVAVSPITAFEQPDHMALALSLIRVAQGSRVALINGRLVGEGDSIGGATVRRIEVTQVHLERDGRHEVLRLFDPAKGLTLVAGEKSESAGEQLLPPATNKVKP